MLLFLVICHEYFPSIKIIVMQDVSEVGEQPKLITARFYDEVLVIVRR